MLHPCLLVGAAAEVQVEAVSQAAAAQQAHSCSNNITCAPYLPQSEQVHKPLDSRLQASQVGNRLHLAGGAVRAADSRKDLWA